MRTLIVSLVLFVTLSFGPILAEDSKDNNTIQEPESQQQTLVKLPNLIDCDDTAKILEMLTKYGEVPVAEMLTLLQPPGAPVIEKYAVFYANPESLTYTIVAHFNDAGKSCIVSMGRNFMPIGGEPGKKTKI